MVSLDVEELNAAMDSFTRSANYAIASLGDNFITADRHHLYTWTWLNVMEKRKSDEQMQPAHYTSDEVSLRCVLRALQGHFPKLHARLFHIDEIGIINCPELLLAVCVDKAELPEPGQYT